MKEKGEKEIKEPEKRYVIFDMKRWKEYQTIWNDPRGIWRAHGNVLENIPWELLINEILLVMREPCHYSVWWRKNSQWDRRCWSCYQGVRLYMERSEFGTGYWGLWHLISGKTTVIEFRILMWMKCASHGKFHVVSSCSREIGGLHVSPTWR